MSVKLEIENIGEFCDALEYWVRDCMSLASQVQRGLAAHAFNFILENSAQFSGDFCQNWNLSIGAPNFSHVESEAPDNANAKILGDPEAIQKAKAKAVGLVDRAVIGDTIFLANGSTHDGDQYAWKIENNKIKFRDGNHGRPVGDWLDYYAPHYAEIDATNIRVLLALKDTL